MSGLAWAGIGIAAGLILFLPAYWCAVWVEARVSRFKAQRRRHREALIWEIGRIIYENTHNEGWPSWKELQAESFRDMRDGYWNLAVDVLRATEGKS